MPAGLTGATEPQSSGRRIPFLHERYLPGGEVVSFPDSSPSRHRLVLLTLCKSKLHRATVTRADLHYVGRITIDSARAAQLGDLSHALDA